MGWGAAAVRCGCGGRGGAPQQLHARQAAGGRAGCGALVLAVGAPHALRRVSTRFRLRANASAAGWVQMSPTSIFPRMSLRTILNAAPNDSAWRAHGRYAWPALSGAAGGGAPTPHARMHACGRAGSTGGRQLLRGQRAARPVPLPRRGCAPMSGSTSSHRLRKPSVRSVPSASLTPGTLSRAATNSEGGAPSAGAVAVAIAIRALLRFPSPVSARNRASRACRLLGTARS